MHHGPASPEIAVGLLAPKMRIDAARTRFRNSMKRLILQSHTLEVWTRKWTPALQQLDRTPFTEQICRESRLDRVRRLLYTWSEWWNLFQLLPELQPHTRYMMLFTLATGLRESNITGLEWNQVDTQRYTAWIHADQSKNGKPIRISLNDDALSILRK